MKNIIFLILFSMPAFAGYMSKASIESCADGYRPFHMKKHKCEKDHLVKCYEVPNNFNCRYHRVSEGKVVVDQSLKATYEAQKLSKRSTKKAKNDEARITLKDKLKDSKDLTNEELRKVLIHLLGG